MEADTRFSNMNVPRQFPQKGYLPSNKDDRTEEDDEEPDKNQYFSESRTIHFKKLFLK